jgi:hypothetical protein
MSGFKISTESLRPEFYQVVLTLSGGTGTYPTADGNDNGAVYPQDHSAFTTKPSTLVIGRRVARGHLRFMNIVDAVSRFADAQIMDVQFASGGATVADNQPTTVTFTIRYDRAGAITSSNILTSVTNSASAVSSTTGGVGLGVASFAPTTGAAVTINTTARALRYLIAQAILLAMSKRVRVWDGGNGFEIDETLTLAAPDTIADIYDDVAVTFVDAAETIDS